MNKLIHTAVYRLKEPSTYAGLSGLALAVGISADGWEVYSTALAGVFGVVAMLMRDPPHQDDDDDLSPA